MQITQSKRNAPDPFVTCIFPSDLPLEHFNTTERVDFKEHTYASFLFVECLQRWQHRCTELL